MNVHHALCSICKDIDYCVELVDGPGTVRVHVCPSCLKEAVRSLEEWKADEEKAKGLP
jgi:hypothetical protein